AAKGAGGIVFDGDAAELHGEGVDDEDASGEGIAFAEDPLDRFHGLGAADHSAKGAEHPGFRAIGDCAGFGRNGKKATVARGAGRGVEDGNLAFETENAAVNERFAGEEGGVV